MKYYSVILLLFCSFFSHGQVNSANIKIDSITSLQLVREKFNPEINKLEIKNGFVLGINDSPLFGSDGEIPKYKLIKATLKIKDKSYNLQVDNMYNPWTGDHLNVDFFKIIHSGENHHLLKCIFSDGAGTYAAQWLIEGNSSIRDIITKDELIIESYFQK